MLLDYVNTQEKSKNGQEAGAVWRKRWGRSGKSEKNNLNDKNDRMLHKIKSSIVFQPSAT